MKSQLEKAGWKPGRDPLPRPDSTGAEIHRREQDPGCPEPCSPDRAAGVAGYSRRSHRSVKTEIGVPAHKAGSPLRPNSGPRTAPMGPYLGPGTLRASLRQRSDSSARLGAPSGRRWVPRHVPHRPPTAAHRRPKTSLGVPVVGALLARPTSQCRWRSTTIHGDHTR